VSFAVQCEAITKADRRCSRPPYATTHEYRWYQLAAVAPSAVARCRQHVPAAEKAALREALDGQPDSWTVSRWLTLPDTPACWSWPVPERAAATDSWATVVDWQAGRCALCGKDGQHLVTDHCHNSGFNRGMLCWGCNVHEGQCPKSPCACDGYRERPPASILGVRVPYSGFGWEDGRPIGYAPGEWPPPPPDVANRWRDNAMRGAL
jgi:hypothetical protein